MGKPDAPGIWYSREGVRVYVNWAFSRGLVFRRVLSNGELSLFHLPIHQLPSDDWMPATPPEFPPLPDRPPACLTDTAGRNPNNRQWRFIREEPRKGALRVVPHKHNDPRAVALITRANSNLDW